MKFTSLVAAAALFISASAATAGNLDTTLVVEEPVAPVVEAPQGGSLGVGAGVALVLLGLIAVAAASGS